VVLAFDSEMGAARMGETIKELQKEHIISLDDAAIVVRDRDGKAHVKQASSLVGQGALGGAFWGMLIGLLFFAPWLGLAIGAISGALAGKFTDIGIDDKFIKEVGNTIQPGNSALFLLVRDATPDKVLQEMQAFPGTTVVKTSLSTEAEAKLKAAFGAAEKAEVQV